jgi:hypothetical protein
VTSHRIIHTDRTTQMAAAVNKEQNARCLLIALPGRGLLALLW